VSLLGMDEARLEQLIAWATQCGIAPIVRGIKSLQTATTARRRCQAKGTSSQEKKYVNLMGGQREDQDLREGKKRLSELGFVVRIVPGPLLLSTTGGRNAKPTPMPLSVGSTFGPTKELLTEAYRLANEDQADPDPDLDLRDGEEPKWSTHSLRRLADTVARRDREATGTTEAEIDIFFGWQERVLKKAMQVHYASMSILTRLGLCRITGGL